MKYLHIKQAIHINSRINNILRSGKHNRLSIFFFCKKNFYSGLKNLSLHINRNFYVHLPRSVKLSNARINRTEWIT